MAAPTPTPRGVPAGARLRDGFKTTVTFGSNLTLSLWETGVKPPNLDGGDPIDTTTMLNIEFHTMAPRSLVKADAMTMTAAYDPSIYGDMQIEVNNEQVITVTFPDTSTVCFHGFLQKFEPSELKEGEFPVGTATIIPTLTDPTDGAEEAPIYGAPLPLAERKKLFKQWKDERRAAKRAARRTEATIEAA